MLGYLDGNLEILKYDNEDTVPIFSSKSHLSQINSQEASLHASSLRALKFSNHSSTLLTIGADRRFNIIDLPSLQIVHSQQTQHNDALYSLQEIEPHIWVTGDDSGGIRLWDLRLTPDKNCVGQIHEQTDGTITSLEVLRSPTQIVATSTQGNLGVYDLRLWKKDKDWLSLHALSDLMEEELNDVKVIKQGAVVACGTSNGVVQLYKKGWYGDCVDRITGHPFSIDTVAKYDENILITGSEDGWVRFCGVHPNRVALFEKHDEDSEEGADFPILKISVSRCKRFLASISNDRCVRFYELGDVAAAVEDKREGQGVERREGGSGNSGCSEIEEEQEEDHEEEFGRKDKKVDPELAKKKDFFKDF